MLVSVWGLLTALVLAHMPVGQPSLAQASGLAARTALLGAPVMALLFLLFPRIGPLWGVPQDGISKTGLSNTMKLGSIAEIAQDSAVAMRIRFDGLAPAPAQMYFRGPVLTHFDGTLVDEAFGVVVIGVAKRPFRGADHAVPVLRGRSVRPLFVTASGVPAGEAAALVARMAGRNRVPDALRLVDALARAG